MNRVAKYLLLPCLAALALLQTRAAAAMIAEWKLDENPPADNVTCLDTMLLHNMTYIDPDPANLYSTTGRWGYPNTAVHFDGAGGFPRTPLKSTSGVIQTMGEGYGSYLQPSTVEAFFKLDSLDSGASEVTRPIFCESNDIYGPGAPVYLLQSVYNPTDQTTKVQFGFYQNSWKYATAPTLLEAGKWYYAASVLDADNLAQRVYVYDGSAMANGSRSWNGWGSAGRTYNDAIGASYAYFRGVIDNVRVYDETLSPETLLAHATTPDVPEPSSLVLMVSALAGLVLFAWRKRG